MMRTKNMRFGIRTRRPSRSKIPRQKSQMNVGRRAAAVCALWPVWCVASCSFLCTNLRAFTGISDPMCPTKKKNCTSVMCVARTDLGNTLHMRRFSGSVWTNARSVNWPSPVWYADSRT